MNIVRLEAENVKKLRAIEIKPDGTLVKITGRNGQGKSTVLDSIFYALSGGRMPRQPIRRGSESARIQLDLGEIIVTRRFTASGSTVSVDAASGARFPSPQRMLDDLVGAIALNPMAFPRLDERKQYDLVRKCMKLTVDIDALDGKNQSDYEKRADVNRDAKRLRGQASGIAYPKDLPTAPVDLAAVAARLKKAGEENALLERRKAHREEAEREVVSLRRSVADLKTREQSSREEADDVLRKAQAAFETILLRAASIGKQANEREAKAKDIQSQLDEAEALPEPIDTAEFISELEAGRTINGYLEAKDRRETLEAEAAALEARSETLTAAMSERDEQKRKAIEAGAEQMAFPGMSLGDGEVLLNGLPLDQASQSELIRLSMAIAMSANPKLRVILIKEGSFLDAESMRIVAEMAGTEGYQVWVEIVDDSGKVGIVIEDGAVNAINQTGGDQSAFNLDEADAHSA
jgi:DNA repair exonuclease SbcCD ATPase subunit